MVSFLLSRPEARHRTFVPPAAKYWWPELFEEIKALIPPTKKNCATFHRVTFLYILFLKTTTTTH